MSASPQSNPSGVRLSAGTMIAERFRVEASGSRDSAGDLYKATDTKNNRPVLLRIFHPELLGDDASRELLKDRVKQAAKIASPNLASIYGMGKHEQTLYLAGELVDGLSLAEHVEKRKQSGSFFPLQGLQKAFMPLVTAMAQAHAQNVVHGAISGRWVQVTDQGRVALRGLGFLWHLVERPEFARILSQSGQALAPEMMEKTPHVTPETDVWGLGALLYELLTNQPVQQGQLTLPSKLRPELPPEFDQVVRRCLATQPSSRLPNAAELQKVLEPIFAPKPAAPKPVLPGPGLKAPQRNQDDEERWLVQKQGLDYGPYTARQVKKQVEEGEITDDTTVLDCDTSARKPIGEHDYFRAFIDDWRKNVAKRTALRESAAIEKSVKQQGKKSFGLVAGILVAVAAIALGYFYLIPKVRDQDDDYPLLLAQVIPKLDDDYNWTSKDGRVPIPKMKKRPGGGGGGGGGGNGGGSSNGGGGTPGVDSGYDDSDTMSFDFDSDDKGPSGPVEKASLSVSDITRGMNAVLGGLAGCAKDEKRKSGQSNFEVSFIITADGRARGVRISRPSGYTGSAVEKCAKSAVSRARFPKTPGETPATYTFGI